MNDEWIMNIKARLVRQAEIVRFMRWEILLRPFVIAFSFLFGVALGVLLVW